MGDQECFQLFAGHETVLRQLVSKEDMGTEVLGSGEQSMEARPLPEAQHRRKDSVPRLCVSEGPSVWLRAQWLPAHCSG